MTCADISIEGYVYNPPSEDKGLILRVTLGCSHNACTFCGMYRDQAFRIKSPDEVRALILETKEMKPNLRRVFLGDGNALAAPVSVLLPILQLLRQSFPLLSTISCAARATDILAKTSAELALLRAQGLSLIYLGVESGDEEVLRRINKGVTAQDTILAGQAADAVGIELSTMIILGLGGRSLTDQHAVHTAEILNRLSPAMLGVMTLLPRSGTPLEQQVATGEFQRLNRRETLQELKNILLRLDLRRSCIFRASRLYNYLSLEGTLPEDRDVLLEQVEKGIREDAAQEKDLEYKNYGIF